MFRRNHLHQKDIQFNKGYETTIHICCLYRLPILVLLFVKTYIILIAIAVIIIVLEYVK